MPSDYYETLGVGREATEQELRRAYRTLAKEHHPDRNDGDPEAEGRFKEILEAYEVLKDDQKRAAYDRYGHAGVRGGGGGGAPGGFGGFDDLGDILEEVFFGGRARPRTRRAGPVPERGADQRLKLRLGFEEAVFGTKRSADVVRRETCGTCGGNGAAPGTTPVRCAACDGMGQVRRVRQSLLGSIVNVETCAECSGNGVTVSERCEECSGRGRLQRSRTLDIDVPAGIEKGTQIRLTGEGEHGAHGGPPGDLYIVLDVEPHATFRRSANELLLDLRVNPADAALGADVEVPTLEGDETITIAPGTQSGDTVRIPERGVPMLRSSGRGDLIITVYVMTPEKLTREQRDLMEQLRSTLPHAEILDHEKGGFWERVRERFT